MGILREPQPAKLFMAIMHRPSFNPEHLLERLSEEYGAVDVRHEPFPFDHSGYYGPEMGQNLVKFLVSFGPLVPPEILPAVKRRTNNQEIAGADKEGRRIYNLDPGILTLSTVILATTKGHAHRIYMGEGIWEEVTLIYRDGIFESLPWTYPDYRIPRILSFMKEVRGVYQQQLSALPKGVG